VSTKYCPPDDEAFRPASATERESVRNPAASVRLRFEHHMERTKARILHVDDHQDTRLMMAALLQDCGYGVLTAGSVAEGLELAREINFDLYILDVRLPDGTGVELCQKLRELNQKIPILYYSAYGDEADHQSALNICGDAYLKKPVCIADIQETIAKLLAEHAGSD
jgi:two-component system, OmpR family, manganese sensing response regulator